MSEGAVERGAAPEGSRPASRVLVLSEDDRLLLLRGRDAGEGRWWVAPGGGVRPGESFAEAAARELLEETGWVLPIGPSVWTRHHRFEWYGKPHDQFEVFFVARTGPPEDPTPVRADGYIIGHRWWSLLEIRQSSDSFAPRRLGDLLGPILRGEFPTAPFDAGV